MNLRRVRAVARKESLHMLRDPRSLVLAIGIPLLMMLLFGYALTLDVDRVPFVVWDQAPSKESRELLARFTGSRYFDLQGTVANHGELERSIDLRNAYFGIVIPGDYAANAAAGRPTEVQVIIDGADSNTAAIVLGYTQAVVQAHNQQAILRRSLRTQGAGALPPLDLRARVWFNADLESRNFIIPGLSAVILGLIAALITSLTIAREWERGTMEQLISTPVKPSELIIGKLMPYFAVGMFDVLLAVLLSVFLFHVPLRGSVTLLFSTAALFIICTLGQGIFISVVTKRQLLASQLAMVATFLPAFLLSGFMFAIANMPAPVQAVTYIVPARYFVAIVKGIYLRGSGLGVLWGEALFLLLFAALVSGAAIRLFKKRLD